MPAYPGKISNQAFANKLTTTGRHWADMNITYSFNDNSTAGNGLNSTYKGWINSVLGQLEDVFGFNFQKVAPGTNAELTYSGTSGAGTNSNSSWFVPSMEMSWSDIQFDRSWTTNQPNKLDYGSYGVTTIIHETLHSMGLSHPGAYNVNADYFPDAEQLRDTRAYSVMSYFDAEEDGSGVSHFYKEGGTWVRQYAQTPLLMDVKAMNEGNFDGKFAGYAFDNVRAGNTKYGYKVANNLDDVFDFKVNKAPIVTIVDSGGKDTLNMSGDKVATKYIVTYNPDNTVAGWSEGVRTKSIIDLREGKFSSTNGMDNNISIAWGTKIENAIGTKFKDTMIGNNLKNVLKGGKGADKLDGKKGNDKLFGQQGDDKFVFRDKYDKDKVLGFSDNNDTLLIDNNLWSGNKTVAQMLSDFGSMNNGNAVLNFGGGDILTIKGMTLGQLQDDINII
jgi:serralysin